MGSGTHSSWRGSAWPGCRNETETIQISGRIMSRPASSTMPVRKNRRPDLEMGMLRRSVIAAKSHSPASGDAVLDVEHDRGDANQHRGHRRRVTETQEIESVGVNVELSLIHISEPTRRTPI